MVSDRSDQALLVLTGDSGAGKTWLCEQIIARHRARGLRVAGVLTLPRVAGGDKIGMDVRDLATGECRPLGERKPCGDGPATATWHFHAASLDWGARVLAATGPCDLLVIDELGPLELLRGEGWIAGLALLRDGRYRRSLVVVRPALLPELPTHLPGIAFQTVTATRANQAECLERIDTWLAPAAGAGDAT